MTEMQYGGVGATFSNLSTRDPGWGFLSLSALHVSVKSKHQEKSIVAFIGMIWFQIHWQESGRREADAHFMRLASFIPIVMRCIMHSVCEMTAKQYWESTPLKTPCVCTKHLEIFQCLRWQKNVWQTVARR